ncbi:MAG: SDR family NAD(P)-dependent oxidoreductase [Candidatus Hydrogenedentes bacterium]|nr:SDR family NAD(P)-dependent oxidoreductase [Candidatus Hydrogenedentota bacterium]
MSTAGKLAGKKALVAGAGTGIGREVALEFARQGADVALHYGHSDKGACSAADEIRAMGRRAEAFQADFDSVDEAIGLAESALAFLGGIDCVVNNAGITFNKPFRKVTVEQFDKMWHVNIRAQFFLTQRLVEDMETRGGGAICNLTSIHGRARAFRVRLDERRHRRLHARARRRTRPQKHSRQRHRARLGYRRELLQRPAGL